MNKDEFLKLTPGRDLDIKVALSVMGYIWLKHLLQFSAELAVKWLGTAADIEESGGVYTRVPDSQFASLKERENFAEGVLPFSTDIQAAEQVVSKMAELGYQYRLESASQQDGDIYYVRFAKLASEQQPDEMVGYSSVPEAIVKAALLAL
jgi:hypothetical protein